MGSTVEAVELSKAYASLLLRLHRLGHTESLRLDPLSFDALAEVMAEPADSFWVRGLRGDDRWWRFGASFAIFLQARRGRSRFDRWIPCSRSVFRGLRRILEAEGSAA